MHSLFDNILKKIKVEPNKKTIIVGGVLLLLTINLLAIFNQWLQPPKVTKLPALDFEVALEQELVLEFNKSPQNIKLVSHPAMQFDLQVYQNTLLAKPTRLYQEATQYQIEIKHKNQTIANFSFTTKLMDETDIIRRDEVDTLATTPLINYTPYETDQFYVFYSNNFELTINLKQGTKTEAEWQIKDWMQNLGIEPNSHTLVFNDLSGFNNNPTGSDTNAPVSPTRKPEEKTRLFEIVE